MGKNTAPLETTEKNNELSILGIDELTKGIKDNPESIQRLIAELSSKDHTFKQLIEDVKENKEFAKIHYISYRTKQLFKENAMAFGDSPKFASQLVEVGNEMIDLCTRNAIVFCRSGLDNKHNEESALRYLRGLIILQEIEPYELRSRLFIDGLPEPSKSIIDNTITLMVHERLIAVKQIEDELGEKSNAFPEEIDKILSNVKNKQKK